MQLSQLPLHTLLQGVDVLSHAFMLSRHWNCSFTSALTHTPAHLSPHTLLHRVWGALLPETSRSPAMR